MANMSLVDKMYPELNVKLFQLLIHTEDASLRSKTTWLGLGENHGFT